MILQDIKETKRYGRTFGRSVGRSDNVNKLSIQKAPSSKAFNISICLEDRNVFVKFDEILSMPL